MEKEQRKRIEHMEATFNKVSEALQDLETALRNWKEKMPLFDEVLEYYTSEDWMIDFDASNEKKFPSPKDFPHGVLGEDTIYNEMIMHRKLAVKMLKMGTKMVDK